MKRSKSTEGRDEPAKKKFNKSALSAKENELHNRMKSSKKSKFEKPTITKKNSVSKDKNDSQQSTEKPDWKAVKQEKKELKEKRKMKRLEKSYDVAKVAKPLGEKLRQTNLQPDEREKYTQELFYILKGNLLKFIFSHDISRIIQWLIKFCTPEMRESILNELKPELSKMWSSKYAVNCIKKMLKYGSTEIRDEILKSCYGRVVNIVSHVISADVFNNAYNKWANELMKSHLKQEFYGDMYKQAKDNNVKCLTDVFKKSSDMKSATLSAVKMNLVRVLNKNVTDNSLVHTVLSEFLTICCTEDRNELIVTLRDSIFELSHTKDGAKAAMICIWHGTAKDRKLSLKSMKDHVKDIAISEHGHIILLSIFDSVDDTVLIKKILIPELVTNLKDIALNEFGKKIILYLVARRDKHHFHPQLIDQLKEGDGNAGSKKSEEIREKELLDIIIDPLLDSIIEDSSFWLANGSIAMVTLAILKSGNGEKLKKSFEMIAQFLISSDMKIKEGKVEYRPIEHPGLHMMLKKLIQGDKLLVEKKESTFGEELSRKLHTATMTKWIEYNRACFLIVLLLENESVCVVSDLKSKILKIIDKIKSKKTPGASILLKKIT